MDGSIHCQWCGAVAAAGTERCPTCQASLARSPGWGGAAGPGTVTTVTTSIVRRCGRCGTEERGETATACAGCGAPLPSIAEIKSIMAGTGAPAGAVTAAAQADGHRVFEIARPLIAAGCPRCGAHALDLDLNETGAAGPVARLTCRQCGNAVPVDLAAAGVTGVPAAPAPPAPVTPQEMAAAVQRAAPIMARGCPACGGREMDVISSRQTVSGLAGPTTSAAVQVRCVACGHVEHVP